jgi:hypothetical protein
MAKQGFPVTLYGCSWGANAGMLEFPTFGSAWIHGAKIGERPCTEFKNYYNYGGTIKWTTPAQLTPVYTHMSDSFVDCWLWHMTRIGKFSGVNGCFFDCFESLPRDGRFKARTDIDGVAYRREDGQLRSFACPLRYHERTRRLATALWLAGRPPSLLQSNNFDNSYGPTWYVEGDMNHSEVGQNLIAKGITPDIAAAYTASCSGMGMVRSDVVTADPRKLSEADEAVFSVTQAYGILYDLPWGGTPSWLSATTKKVGEFLKTELLNGDPRVKHIRYWNPGNAFTISDKRILVGGFVHPENKCALIAVLNPTAEKITGNVIFSKSVLGRDTSTVTDLLTGAAVASGNKTGFDLGAYGVKFLIVK